MTSPRTVSRSELVRDVIGLLARLGLAAVWLISGIIKAVDPRTTVVAVRAYQIFPESLVGTIAGILPFLEIALGVLLVIGLATRLTAVLSAVVLVAFIAGVISAAARGLSIDCGCFGGGGDVAAGQTAYTEEILRDLGFLALAVYLIVRPDTPLSVDRWVRRRTGQPA
ncbi:MAG TPA: DoxX family protein [Mycobacterium sp.]